MLKYKISLFIALNFLDYFSPLNSYKKTVFFYVYYIFWYITLILNLYLIKMIVKKILSL